MISLKAFEGLVVSFIRARLHLEALASWRAMGKPLGGFLNTVKEFCFEEASKSLLWKRMRPLMPNAESGANLSTILLIEIGALVPNPSALFSDYFTPIIDKSVLNLSVDDFANRPSV